MRQMFEMNNSLNPQFSGFCKYISFLLFIIY